MRGGWFACKYMERRGLIDKTGLGNARVMIGQLLANHVVGIVISIFP